MINNLIFYNEHIFINFLFPTIKFLVGSLTYQKLFKKTVFLFSKFTVFAEPVVKRISSPSLSFSIIIKSFNYSSFLLEVTAHDRIVIITCMMAAGVASGCDRAINFFCSCSCFLLLLLFLMK